MTFRNRQAKTLAYLCAATTALAACSSTPEAGRPDVTSSSSPSSGSVSSPLASTSTPTEAPRSAPERPAAASGLQLSAAEEFLKHYLALLNFTYTTGNTEALLAASDEGCVGCKGTAAYLEKTNGQNGGLSGDYADHLVAVKELFRGSSERVGGSMTVRSGNYTERATPNSKPTPKGASTETWQFTLAPSNGNWVMYEIQVEE